MAMSSISHMSVQCSAISPHPRAAKVPMVQLAHRWPGAGHAAEGGSLEHRGSSLFVEEAMHEMPAIAGVVPPCTRMGKIEALAVTRGSLRPTCREL